MDSKSSNRIFKTIDDNSVVSLSKDTAESMYQFVKRNELYIKAKNANIDEDRATMLSVAYSNKLKYNVTYRPDVESTITSILAS